MVKIRGGKLKLNITAMKTYKEFVVDAQEQAV